MPTSNAHPVAAMAALACCLLFAPMLTACASHTSPPPQAPAAAGADWSKTHIALRTKLAWPYRLGAVTIALDGITIFHATEYDSEQHKGEIRRIVAPALEPGAHVITATVDVAYRQSLAGDDCTVQLQWSRGIRAGWRPARIGLEVHLEDITLDFAERIQLTARVRGAELVSHRSVAGAPPELGVPKTAEAMIATAEARLVSAQLGRDTEQLACHHRALETLRRLSRLRSRQDDLRRRSVSAETRRHHQGVVRAVDARMRAAWAHMNGCRGADGHHVETARRSVSAGCHAEQARFEAKSLFGFDG